MKTFNSVNLKRESKNNLIFNFSFYYASYNFKSEYKYLKHTIIYDGLKTELLVQIKLIIQNV